MPCRTGPSLLSKQPHSPCSSVPHDIEGAPSFAESAVLILRSEQRLGLRRCQQLPLCAGYNDRPCLRACGGFLMPASRPSLPALVIRRRGFLLLFASPLLSL